MGVHLLQLAIFFFQFLQPLQLRGIHPAIFGFPFVESTLTETLLTAEFGHWHTGFCFFEDLDDLLLAVCFSLHGISCPYYLLILKIQGDGYRMIENQDFHQSCCFCE